MKEQTTVKKIELVSSSLSEQVYHYIKKMILSGELKGGDRIPEEKVGRSFGVSRTPIREALQKLSEHGLVHLKPRSYAVVASLQHDETTQIAHIRAQLETLSARLLVEKGNDEDFDELEAIIDDCEELIMAGDVASAFESDSAFHLEIARRTCNSHLFDIFEKIDAKVQLSRLVIKLPLEKLQIAIGQHRTILQAMRNRDKELAETLMKHHILHQLSYFK